MTLARATWARASRFRLLKYWGGRRGVWLGMGWQSERTRLIERSWLRTILPPYLDGPGVCFAVRYFTVRVGWYRTIGDYGMYDEVVDTDGELAVLSWAMEDGPHELNHSEAV